MKCLLSVLLLLLLPFAASADGNDTINERLSGKIEWEGYYMKGERTGKWKVYGSSGYYVQGRLENGLRTGW